MIIVDIIKVTFRIIGMMIGGLLGFRDMLIEELDEWEKEKTFIDMYDAIEFVANDKGWWAFVSNGIQYEWLMKHKQHNNYKVTVNTDESTSKMPELSFKYQYKNKLYSVNVKPDEKHKRRYVVHVV